LIRGRPIKVRTLARLHVDPILEVADSPLGVRACPDECHPLSKTGSDRLIEECPRANEFTGGRDPSPWRWLVPLIWYETAAGMRRRG
jgi:hypothetical protein